MLKSKQISRIGSIFTLLFLLFVWTTPVFAASKDSTSPAANSKSTSAPVDISNDVANTYNADASVQQGMIVQLKENAPTDIVALTSLSPDKILGIVIPNTNVTIVLTPATVTKQQVLVATKGKYSVLVSNQNGPIKVGDYLSISAIAGVAMKAGVDQPQVVGRATSDFSGTASVISSLTLKDQSGKDTKVAIGRIIVDITIAHNPLNQKTVDFVPAFLIGLAQSVANKSVSVARIYLSSVILFVSTIVTAIMLYSGVRSGMIAVGRNPLSKKSIMKSLFQTVIAGLIVFIVGVLAVYLLLKL